MAAPQRGSWLKFVIFIAAVILLWYLGRAFHIDIAALKGYFSRFPLFYSGFIFIAFYVVVTFFIWLSKDVFRIAAALVFGAWWSTLFIFAAECINAVILFHASRYLGRDFVEKKLAHGGRGLYDKIGRANFLWLFLFRVTPFLPFRFLDLGSGLTGMSFKRYFSAVVIGSPLRIFWVQFVLAGVGEAVFKDPYALSKYMIANRTLLLLSLVYLVLVVAVAVRIKKWQ